MRIPTGPFLVAAVVLAASVAAQNPTSARIWHTVELTFTGPAGLSETSTPNPFTDFRMDVTWTGPGGRSEVVPGHYAADGDAAESGAATGRIWRALFVPDRVGTWNWTVSFVQGAGVAVAGGGTPTGFDGAAGSVQVSPTDKSLPDFRARGMLRHVDDRYLRFAGDGEWFLEIGPGSPENVLAYEDFDGTVDRGGEIPNFLHAFAPHRQHFASLGGGDTWRGNRGEALMGALNYLSSQGLNSFMALTWSGYGDGDDVWPWTDRDEPQRYDVSKLDQWQRVLDHATKRGLHVQVMLGETENESFFEIRDGGGDFSPDRKLYYREMISRFGHVLGLTWNLGEEIGWNTGVIYSRGTTDAQRRAFAIYMKQVDPYDHPVIVHTYHNNRTGVGQNGILDPLSDPNNPALEINGASLQGPFDSARSVIAPSADENSCNHAKVVRWVTRSQAAGNPWHVCAHEQMPPFWGSVTDGHPRDREHDLTRKDVLWGTYMAGGSGVLHYVGYAFRNTTGDDVNLEDFATRTDLWRQSRLVKDFFETHLPFHRMDPADALTDDPLAFTLAEPGEIYAVFRRDSSYAVRLDLGTSTREFSVRWFDPKNGGVLQRGSVTTVTGPGQVDLGSPPGGATTADWLAVVEFTRRRPNTGCSTAGLAFDGVIEVGGWVRTRFVDLPQHNRLGMLFGAANQPIDVPQGLGCASPCLVDVRPDTWVGDVAEFRLPLPNEPALVGASFRVQGFLSQGTGRQCLAATSSYEVVLQALR